MLKSEKVAIPLALAVTRVVPDSEPPVGSFAIVILTTALGTPVLAWMGARIWPALPLLGCVVNEMVAAGLVISMLPDTESVCCGTPESVTVTVMGYRPPFCGVP